LCVPFIFERPHPEKYIEDMSINELEEAVQEKPKPIPRARKSSHTIEAKEKEKPIEEMDVDEMIKAASESAPFKEERHEFDSESEESEIDEEINEEIADEEVNNLR
jgi:hypothetical protein